MERFNPAGEINQFSLDTPEKDLPLERVLFRRLSGPLTVQWELTSWCNQSCFHCYNYWRRDELSATSGLDSAGSAKCADEIIKNNVFSVTLTGGEPLYNLDQSVPALEALRDKGIGIDINTNLAFFDKAVAAKLKSLGVRSILTSLMTSNPELNDRLSGRKGTFERVTKGIDLALKEGFHVGVSMVVTKDNLSDIYETAEYVTKLGATTFAATKACAPVNASGFYPHCLSTSEFNTMLNVLLTIGKELNIQAETLVAPPLCVLDTPELAEKFGHKSCAAGKISCTIGYNGLIRSCSQGNSSYGSILDEGLNPAWHRMQEWRTDKFVPSICKECSVADICIGGCRAEAMAINGRLDSPNPYADPYSVLKVKDTNPGENKAVVDKRYFFNSNIKQRPEDFGGILFISSARWLPVDHLMLRFINLYQGKTFSSSDLSKELNYDIADIMSTVNLLESKGFILARGGD